MREQQTKREWTIDGKTLWLGAVTVLVLLCQAGVHVPPSVWTAFGFAPAPAVAAAHDGHVVAEEKR